jgi:hypothetical protein
MSKFHRLLSGLASIGTGITLFRVARLLWPVDPLSTMIVVFSLIITMFSQLERAMTGKGVSA